jgi:hypothetical protein
MIGRSLGPKRHPVLFLCAGRQVRQEIALGLFCEIRAFSHVPDDGRDFSRRKSLRRCVTADTIGYKDLGTTSCIARRR